MIRPRATASLVLVLAATAALSSGLLGGRPAQASASSLPAGQSSDSVLVTGRGQVSGRPDTAVASFAVEATAPTVLEALERANAAATRMQDSLVRAGMARADLQTSDAGISPRRDDAGDVTGYTTSQGLTATIRNLPRAGTLLTAAIAAGGDAARLNGLSFAIEDDAALLAEARRKAFADARATAALYAREAGRSLGRVVKVSEETSVPGGGRGWDGMAADSPVPVEPGRQRLAVTVTVEWALDPPAPGGRVQSPAWDRA